MSVRHLVVASRLATGFKLPVWRRRAARTLLTSRLGWRPWPCQRPSTAMKLNFPQHPRASRAARARPAQPRAAVSAWPSTVACGSRRSRPRPPPRRARAAARRSGNMRWWEAACRRAARRSRPGSLLEQNSSRAVERPCEAVARLSDRVYALSASVLSVTRFHTGKKRTPNFNPRPRRPPFIRNV